MPTIATPTPDLVRQIQSRLKAAGFFLGTSGPARDGVDGEPGPLFYTAVLAAIGGKPASPRLVEPARFFANLKEARLFSTIEQSQVDGMNRLVAAFERAAWPIAFAAYGLATSYHETGKRMQPCKERGNGDGPDADHWDDYLERYDTGRLAAALGNTPEADGDGVFYAGWGDVQLTGRANYAWAEKATGFPLLAKPELMGDPAISAAVLVKGLSEGAFTGRKLRDYLPLSGPATTAQFRECRRTVNALDRATDIAGYALGFQTALAIGGWL